MCNDQLIFMSVCSLNHNKAQTAKLIIISERGLTHLMLNFYNLWHTFLSVSTAKINAESICVDIHPITPLDIPRSGAYIKINLRLMNFSFKFEIFIDMKVSAYQLCHMRT